jgi:hypothetical protein
MIFLEIGDFCENTVQDIALYLWLPTCLMFFQEELATCPQKYVISLRRMVKSVR